MEELEQYEGALTTYFAELGDSEHFTGKEEFKLYERIKEGDIDARNELVKGNLKFVVDVATIYKNGNIPLEELIAAGNTGLIRAAEEFDGSKGYKFITYAVWWVREAILRTMGMNSRTVRLPMNKLSLLKDVGGASLELYRELDREPTYVEIAEFMGTRDYESIEMLVNSFTYSLDEPEHGGSRESKIDSVPDLDAVDSSTKLEEEELKETMEGLLNTLDPRDAFIIRHYFGFGGNELLTLEQIGTLTNLTRERVRQLRNRALNKLRGSGNMGLLMEFID